MLVVSDTTALTSLAAIDRLELLRDLYDSVVIPEAVRRELFDPGPDNPGSIAVETTTWITTRVVTEMARVAELVSLYDGLGRGEAEAIVLASELDADLLLIDDGFGRRIATQRNIPIIGLAGSLIEAKRRSIIPEVKPVLDLLVDVAGFYLARSLYDYVLVLAGEA